MQTGNNHKTATKKSNVAKILLVMLQMDFFSKTGHRLAKTGFYRLSNGY